MSVADQKQVLGAQFVEEIVETRRHRFFVKLPDELKRFLVDERAVRNPGELAEKMKDHAMRASGHSRAGYPRGWS